MRSRLLHGAPYWLLSITPSYQSKLRKHGLYAQPDKTIALSYALKNSSVTANGVIRNMTYMVVGRNPNEWATNLPHTVEKNEPGGFVYEIERRAFQEVVGREWAATRKVAIIRRKTRFATITDCMNGGVQIFIVKDQKKYSHKAREWTRGNFPFIQRGIEDKGLIWLNAETGINPILPIGPGRFSISRKPRHPGFKLGS